MIETKCIKEFGEEKIIIHETEIFEHEAKIALSLLDRWGMVAASPDGEDSAGRAQLRLSTPEELVERAFAVAKLAINHTRDNGLIHDAGSLPEPKAKA